MTDTNVITLFPRGDAPVQPLPRSHFGLAPPTEDVARGMSAAGEDDRRNDWRIRAAGAAVRAALGDRAHICPSLRADLAAEINVIAKLCATAAESAKSLGELRACASLRDHQHLLETLAAECSPDVSA